jgi:hypothetical protein
VALVRDRLLADVSYTAAAAGGSPGAFTIGVAWTPPPWRRRDRTEAPESGPAVPREPCCPIQSSLFHRRPPRRPCRADDWLCGDLHHLQHVRARDGDACARRHYSLRARLCRRERRPRYRGHDGRNGDRVALTRTRRSAAAHSRTSQAPAALRVMPELVIYRPANAEMLTNERSMTLSTDASGSARMIRRSSMSSIRRPEPSTTWTRLIVSLSRPSARICCSALSIDHSGRIATEASVGHALRRYLDARPTTEHRSVFLTVRAPFRPISAGALYHLVASRMPTSDRSRKGRGPHGLRHGI